MQIEAGGTQRPPPPWMEGDFVLLLYAINCSLERRTGFECWHLGCLDLEFRTRFRVTSNTGCALAHFERAKTNQ